MMQHDAHEFFLFLLDKLQEETTPADSVSISNHGISESLYWSKWTKSHPSVIDRLFVGLNRTRVKCAKCGKTSQTYAVFYDLNLPCEGSIQKGLKKFTADAVTNT